MNLLRKIDILSRRIKYNIKYSINRPIVILGLHHISAKFDPSTQDIGIWTSLEDFEKSIINLKNAGFNFISLDEVINIQNKKNKPDKKYISVTFDDGHKSILNVIPIIEKYEIPVTFFINSDSIGDAFYNWVDMVQYFSRHPKDYYLKFNITKDDWQIIESIKTCNDNANFLRLESELFSIMTKINDFKIRHLTEEELFSLNHPLVTIGLHAARHYKYDIMEDVVLYENIKKDLDYVKSHLGFKPFFAFPFGRYKTSSLEIIRKFNLIPFFYSGGVNYCSDVQFGFKRIPVGNHLVTQNYIADQSKELTFVNHFYRTIKVIKSKI